MTAHLRAAKRAASAFAVDESEMFPDAIKREDQQ